MDLRGYLLAIADGYSQGSLSSPGHVLLKDASSVLGPLLPGGLVVEGSGGKGVATLTPWIGVFDPDETDTPQSGIYVVYIYSADLSRVILTLNQGVTKLRHELGQKEAIKRLRADVAAVRSGLAPDGLTGTLADVSFGVDRQLQRAYEAGNICGIDYDLAGLPSLGHLEADLERLVELYQEAVAVKRHLLLSAPGTISSPSLQQPAGGGPTTDPLREFAPKSDSDYVAHLSGKRLVKSRRHETLVKQFGDHAAGLGLAPATNVHPRDMTLAPSAQEEWLVEAKVVYNGNVTHAVREAIGQLLQYRHFLYPAGSAVRLLGLFSEPIGDAYVALLESLGITGVWKDGDGWAGSPTALRTGLLPA